MSEENSNKFWADERKKTAELGAQIERLKGQRSEMREQILQLELKLDEVERFGKLRRSESRIIGSPKYRRFMTVLYVNSDAFAYWIEENKKKEVNKRF
jgi:hypothetical protein